jgi:hypothetical protein
MQRLSFERPKLPLENERVLKEVAITEDGPGTILKDFEIFLNYLRKQGLLVAGTHRLPRTVLGEMNALLSHPIQLRLKRPEQKSYPHIQGLYLLLRASGLACIEGKDGKLFLSVDDRAYQVWGTLNPTERYFVLLETWLLRGKEEIVGERGGGLFSIPDSFRGVIEFFRRVPEKGLRVAGDRNAEYLLRYAPGWKGLFLVSGELKRKLARTKTCLSPFESEKKATSCIGNSGAFLIVGSVRIYHPPDHFLVGCAISFCFLLKKIYT